MDTPPPRWIRRLLLAPVVFVGAVILTLLSPLALLVAAALDLIFDRRRWRMSRFVGLALAFCAVEVFGLFALLTVWLGSGFGLFMQRPFWVRANMKLIGQWFELITRAIRFSLGFGFSYTYERVPTGPQILFARHAGPGDALLIARVVVRDFGRRLHMVGAAKLQWDPFLDIAGERLGFHYIRRDPGRSNDDLDAIRGLTARLGPHETFVIFPEGGNFTTKRRDESIEALRERERHVYAVRAESLQHTLLPRAGGAIAAIEGAPDASVMFLAHAGLENLHGVGDLWSSVPLRKEMRAHSWLAPKEDIPVERVDRTTWLHDHWARIDDWIEKHLDVPPCSSPGEEAPTK